MIGILSNYFTHKNMNRISSLAKRIVFFPVKDSQSIRRIAEQLTRTPNDSIILPVSDHPGLLCNEILSRRFGSLTICEQNDTARQLLHSHVRDKFPNRKVHVHSDNLIELSFQVHDDSAQRRCSEVVAESINSANSAAVESACDRRVKFLVPLMTKKYESSFLKNLYYQMSLRHGLCSDTLVHYYYLMSARQHKYLIAKPSGNLNLYRSTTILYNTMFNVHTLDTFDLSTSFEIKLKSIQKPSYAAKQSAHHLIHLVWLEPRVDIINALDARSWIEFRFLVNQMMMRRKRLVVPYLCNWFEDCWKDINRLGITETTRSGDMNKEQFLQLYLYLRDRQDYRNSTFLQAVECYDQVMPSLANV